MCMCVCVCEPELLINDQRKKKKDKVAVVGSESGLSVRVCESPLLRSRIHFLSEFRVIMLKNVQPKGKRQQITAGNDSEHHFYTTLRIALLLLNNDRMFLL